MARIMVIGNCQAEAVAEAMRFHRPDAFVKHLLSWELSRWYDGVEAFQTDLRSFDAIFCQDVDLAPFVDNQVAGLKALFPATVEFPIIVFPAYHPDLIYIALRHPTAQFFSSPIGPYNSALALLGYKCDLTAYQTRRLFQDAVYDKLGYYDLWTSSHEALLKSGRASGLRLDDAFAVWARSGCFMHSINHAKIGPLNDISTMLLRKVFQQTTFDDATPFLVDPASKDAVWPIYPEIAERFGLRGSYTFRCPDYIAQSGQKYFPLDQYIVESFKSFGFFPKDALTSDRVDAWLADKALISWIKAQV